MKNKEKGQTIIEAIVALTTLLLLISAIAIVIVNSLSNSQYISDQNRANKYAQQGMEFVREIQQNDLQKFSTFANDTRCIKTNVAPTPNELTTADCDAINIGNQNRKIIFSQQASPCSINETKVTVIVSWSSTKCSSTNTFCHNSTLVSCLPYQTINSSP